MLALTLRKKESVLLNVPGVGEVRVKISKSSSSRVSIAVDAPQEIRISRDSQGGNTDASRN